MTEEQIRFIKETAATLGAVVNLKDGTKIYCDSEDQLYQVLKKRNFSDASYVEYGKEHPR